MIVLVPAGASVYMQSGSEYDNLLNHSVILCPAHYEGIRTTQMVDGVLQNTTVNWRRCICSDCVPGQGDGDDSEQAGVYMVSPNNKVHGGRGLDPATSVLIARLLVPARLLSPAARAQRLHDRGPSPQLLHNVISGVENAVYVNQAASRRSGEDHANGRTCASNQPIGEVRGNVFKQVIGFGWYGNNLWPIQVGHTADGFVANSWEECHPFDLESGVWSQSSILPPWAAFARSVACRAIPEAAHDLEPPPPLPPLSLQADRHFNTIFEDHTEYGGNFGFGGYSLGDTTLRNFHTSDSGATYWKTYHRAPHSGPFCDGCRFASGMTGPGGDALVEFRDTTFGRGAIRVNHHCNLHAEATGGLCAPHYYVASPISTHHEGLVWVNEASDCATDILLTYNGKTRFLLGDCASPGCGCEGAFAIFDDSACVTEHHQDQRWRACPESWKLRTLKIYSPDRGNLIVTSSDGVSRTVWKRSVHNKWSGSLGYNRVAGDGLVNSPNGYSFIVRDGTDVTIHVSSNLTKPEERFDHFVMDLGHHGWDQTDPSLNAHVRVTVTGDEQLAGGPCWVHENASRTFLTGFGSLISDAGEWVRCKREVLGSMWPLEVTRAQYVASFRARNPMWRPPPAAHTG